MIDLDELQYFSGIFLSMNKLGLLLSQQKYVKNMVLETAIENMQVSNTSLELFINLDP